MGTFKFVRKNLKHAFDCGMLKMRKNCKIRPLMTYKGYRVIRQRQVFSYVSCTGFSIILRFLAEIASKT